MERFVGRGSKELVNFLSFTVIATKEALSRHCKELRVTKQSNLTSLRLRKQSAFIEQEPVQKREA